MESNEINEHSANQANSSQDAGVITPSQGYAGTTPLVKDVPCSSCEGEASMPMSYVYALGRIEARFPRLSIEKEFAQIAGRGDNGGKTDQQVFHDVLTKPENRYLVRQMCWVFTIQGLETYLLGPRNPADYDLLAAAIRPTPGPGDIDCVVGVRGPIASPDMCNGLMVPIVAVDQHYSFTRDDLIQAIPRPEQVDPEKYGPAAEEVFDRIMLMTDNAGATDEHRALNYLAVRYPAIYAKTAEQFGLNFSLNRVETRPSPLSATRNIVEVIFSFTNRNTDFSEKFSVRVDVTEEFPFLVTKLSPYFDR